MHIIITYISFHIANYGFNPQEQELKMKQQKKKKMTPAERAEAARLEEERIRNIEMELADSEAIPKTADQFDRLVLANPNNSMLWINYMAFHLEVSCHLFCYFEPWLVIAKFRH